jgi:hypothetical protein
MLEQLPFRVTDSEQLVGMRNKGGKGFILCCTFVTAVFFTSRIFLLMGIGCMGKSVLTKIQEIITTDGLEKLSG